jgi:hypothetical protein
MIGYSRELLKRTVELWQPYSSKELSSDDAREIAENAVNLFTLLIELERKIEANEQTGTENSEALFTARQRERTWTRDDTVQGIWKL